MGRESFGVILRKKAWFLENIFERINIESPMAHAAQLREEAADIMGKAHLGCRQKEAASEKYIMADQIMARLQQKIGAEILGVYRFLDDNSKHLSKTTRLALNLEPKKKKK